MFVHTKCLASAVFVSTLGLSGGGLAQDVPIGILLAAGDIAGCHQSDRQYEEVAELLGREITAAANRGLPVGVLALGDIAYKGRGKSYAQCLEAFATSWGSHYDIIFPVAGNHDYSDDGKPGAQLYMEYFEDRLSTLGATDSYYAARFPDTDGAAWLLLGIDGNRDHRTQRDWVEDRLVDSGAPPCALVFSHQFVTSSGEHGREERNWTNANMAKAFAVLVENGGDLFVGAHDHHYERFAARNAALAVDPGGARSFIVGTGGAHLYDLDDTDRAPQSESYIDDRAGVLKLELSAAGYSWSFIDIEDAVLDSGSGTCAP